MVRFVIGPDGRVTQSELAQPTTFSSGVVACVLKAVKGVKAAARVELHVATSVMVAVVAVSVHVMPTKTKNNRLRTEARGTGP